MTVRLPEELDAKLEAAARARHTSKHALLIEAADRFLSQDEKTARAADIARGVTARYSGLLKKLEDA